jgi:hypothetical protein
MIKAQKNENFLMNKIKRKLDKSVFSESMGTQDEHFSGFDSDLSPTLSDSVLTASQPSLSTDNIEVDSVKATDDLNYLLTKIQQDKKSKYHLLEEQRKQRLAAAKMENKRKREALEKSTLSAEAAAYQKGLADSHAQYQAFNGKELEKEKKAKKKALSFSTATGLKDDLNLNNKKRSLGNEKTLSPIAPLQRQAAALRAIIDQKQKFRNGDKIQLRILETGFYQQYQIPQNTLLYGICAISANRMHISVSSINLETKVIPTHLAVYDLDGMSGIYINGIYQDATKQAINQGLADVGNLGLKNTLGNLSIRLGRKANQKQTAFIPAGYEVLLFDSQNL